MGMISNLSAEEKSDLIRYLQELDDVPETTPQPDPEPDPGPVLPPMSAESSSACTVAGAAVPGRAPLSLAARAGLLALVLLRRASPRPVPANSQIP